MIADFELPIADLSFSNLDWAKYVPRGVGLKVAYKLPGPPSRSGYRHGRGLSVARASARAKVPLQVVRHFQFHPSASRDLFNCRLRVSITSSRPESSVTRNLFLCDRVARWIYTDKAVVISSMIRNIPSDNRQSAIRNPQLKNPRLAIEALTEAIT